MQLFDDIYDQINFNRIVNHVRGERMEIYSHESDHLIYHGEFNEKREREGWGIEYDAETGAMLLEGIWKGNKLVEIIRKIEGTIMIEFKRNGNNTIASNRIPVFVGEFVYDEEKNRLFEMVEAIGLMRKLGLLLAKWNGKMEWK